MKYREALALANGEYAVAMKRNNDWLRPIDEQLILERLYLNLKHSEPDNPNDRSDPPRFA